MQLRHTLIVEWHLSANQNVKDNAETPYIHFRARVLSRLKQLRGCKIETSTECLEEASGRKEVAETKIDDFDVAGLADEDVLDLQITMDDAVAMAIIQRTGDLPSKLARLLLLQFPVGDDVVQHLATIHIFE